MNQRGFAGLRGAAERDLPWHMKNDCDRQAGSPCWQARIHLDQWSGRRGSGKDEGGMIFAMRKLAGNCVQKAG